MEQAELSPGRYESILLQKKVADVQEKNTVWAKTELLTDTDQCILEEAEHSPIISQDNVKDIQDESSGGVESELSIVKCILSQNNVSGVNDSNSVLEEA